MRVLPSDERVQRTTSAQWLWMYYNLIEDEKEEHERLKQIIDYVSWFVNPELYQKVKEQEQAPKFAVDEEKYQEQLQQLKSEAPDSLFKEWDAVEEFNKAVLKDKEQPFNLTDNIQVHPEVLNQQASVKEEISKEYTMDDDVDIIEIDRGS